MSRKERGSAPPYGERFAFGGVGFELLAAAGSDGAFSPLVLEPEVARYRLPEQACATLAEVLCSVAVDGPLFAGSVHHGALALGAPDPFEVLPRGLALELRAPRVRASLRCLGPRRYAVSAQIADTEEALGTLLRTVAGTVLQAEGGLLVHAAGIALDGRAVLYVGPSGAGKSTAATLTDGAEMFARDHVALVPQSGGDVIVYGLPGGQGAEMPQTNTVVWPLAAVFRILRDRSDRNVAQNVRTSAPHGALLTGAAALFALRESVECADVSPLAEEVRLNVIAEIAARTRVGTLHTVLGVPLADCVRQLLGARA